MKKINWLWLGLAVSLAGCVHQPLGGPCTSNRQCAGKLTCLGGECAKTNCGPAGAKCSTNDDCCGTLFCSGRTCH